MVSVDLSVLVLDDLPKWEVANTLNRRKIGFKSAFDEAGGKLANRHDFRQTIAWEREVSGTAGGLPFSDFAFS